MSGGLERVRATFWLLEARDSLVMESRRNPDGTGIGYYDEDGTPIVEKQPLAAYADQQFAQEAKEARSRTFIAHVRHASGTPVTLENTHPFEQAGRLFAHNGVIGDVPALERELGEAMSSVHGQTDSERYFTLITREIERTGEVGEGIVSAAGWIADHLPLYAINCVLITDAEVWALRYPDVHELHVLERAAGGPSGSSHLEHGSARRPIRVRSEDLGRLPAVVVASEEMDEDTGWRELRSGELLHVDPDLNVEITTVLDRPPAHQLTLEDLDPKAAESQRAAARA
jgi:predicted glutamine amidotransferase